MLNNHEIIELLKKAKSRIKQLEASQSSDIAVIGMACQFPDADNPMDFWHLLHAGRSAIRNIPSDRLSSVAHEPIQKAALIKKIAYFDPVFFNLSKREADALDPQHRLLLETTWHALENALIPLETIRGSNTGIFMGLSWRDYEKVAYGVNPHGLNAYTGLGNMQSFAAGRLAYFLGTHGPAMVLDTACSSSLVAIHEAIKSLRSRETSLALAGGASLILSHLSTVLCCELKALSPTNSSRIFDDRADGYVRGEGVGVVVLKRLEDAVHDLDPILGIIKGSAVNHNGQSSGLTVPNRQAQKQLITSALVDAHLSIREIDYIETHGTGTLLGDPIEVGALSDLNEFSHKTLHIGSVKANIGHLEAAAGVASFIKAILMLQQRMIPPQINLHQLNQRMDWMKGMIDVTQELTPWNKPDVTIGISSFGISGTNAHLIVRTYPEEKKSRAEQHQPNIFVLSAKTPSALRALATIYFEWLSDESEALFSDLCFSLQTGRTHFRYRLAFVVSQLNDILENLKYYLSGSLSIGEPHSDTCLQRLACEYLAGGTPNWFDIYEDRTWPSKIMLKNYVFDRQYCWVAQDYSNSQYHSTFDYLYDHLINDEVIYPGTGYIYALCKRFMTVKSPEITFENLEYRKPLYITHPKIPDFNFELNSTNHISLIHHQSTYCTCDLVSQPLLNHPEDLSRLIHLPADYIDVEHFYFEMAEKGYQLRGLFQRIDEIRALDKSRFLVRINNTEHYDGLIHPAILDACFQVSFLLLDKDTDYLPSGIKKIWIQNTSSVTLWSYLFMKDGLINCYLYTDSLLCVVQAIGLMFKKNNLKPKRKITIHHLNDLETLIIGEVSKLTHLNIEDIDIEASFWDFGFDSLMWIELKDSLEDKLKKNIDDSALFNYPSIRKFSEYVYDHFFTHDQSLDKTSVSDLRKELLND